MWSTKSTNQGLDALKETELVSTGPKGVCTSLLSTCYASFLVVFIRLLTVRTRFPWNHQPIQDIVR